MGEDTLDLTQDGDIVHHKTIPPLVAKQFQTDRKNGPNLDELHPDMKGSLTSEWNVKAINLLVECLEVKHLAFDLPERSQAYKIDLIKEKIKHLRVVWKDFQPKTTDTGEQESPEALETRLLTKHVMAVKEAQQFTSANSESDLVIWEWLQRLVQLLGTERMSSEESGEEGDLEDVLQVKTIPWCRDLEKELAIINQ
ncbi:hypothetical protein K439DRAFT_1350125 [Ramaria rubella]|nr:hypothetical protein K439DRAFT_1350125 [Ramaria rubella]